MKFEVSDNERIEVAKATAIAAKHAGIATTIEAKLATALNHPKKAKSTELMCEAMGEMVTQNIDAKLICPLLLAQGQQALKAHAAKLDMEASAKGSNAE